MQRFFLFRSKARRLCLLLVAMIAVGLPVGCSVLAQKERELVFRIEPGNASWFSGLPRGVEELQLTHSTFGNQQNIHAWWWPAADADAPALLYLHGVRWNLTGHLFRLEQLRNLGFSVLAIDYRGFGQSLGELPSERSVYADARVGWERLKALQPDPDKRFIYGHSLGGAVAVDLAAELGEQAERGDSPPQARALIIESTFTSLADVATVVSDTTLPVRWLLSQKFDSIDKIDRIGMPLLVV
ncbi:MAG TPA: alpha/beta hydrolase, partial [Pseudomonas sp.]|nr:alpha/beta hydrolase [Pseudomonas sp.]